MTATRRRMTPTRPALRWHGGKWRLAPWIIAHLPPHRRYVEPFGGAASVLIRKARVYAEVYNDLDDEVVGLFKVLRDPQSAARLRELLALTPFARTEFRAAYEMVEEPVERARRLIIRSFMGFGSNAHASAAKGHRSTGFRSNSSRSGTTPATDWRNYPDAMAALIERLAGVVVENRDAREVMLQHDGSDTLHYVDPPYVHETRSIRSDGSSRYRHELSRDDHVEMLAFLIALGGMVILSGYPEPLYDKALPGWRRVACGAFADGARARTEVLWINPAATDGSRGASHPSDARPGRRGRMTATRRSTDPLAHRHAPGPAVEACSSPGCREHASWGLYGAFYCGPHRPGDFLELAESHSREVRRERGRAA